MKIFNWVLFCYISLVMAACGGSDDDGLNIGCSPFVSAAGADTEGFFDGINNNCMLDANGAQSSAAAAIADCVIIDYISDSSRLSRLNFIGKLSPKDLRLV